MGFYQDQIVLRLAERRAEGEVQHDGSATEGSFIGTAASAIITLGRQNSLTAKDCLVFDHACFATRLGGVSGGKETQGCRVSSHTAMAGAGKFGSAKLPMATATYPGKPWPSQ
jgi:hypothetical protein